MDRAAGTAATDGGEPVRARWRSSRLVTAACWLVTVPGLAWAVIRVFGLERGGLVQLLAFTPYLAGWALAPLALALVLRRWPVAAVAGLATVAL
ncbi:MAG TPA: hypothetical protein VF462_05110, partial [Micromonosporaceae bacterium]